MADASNPASFRTSTTVDHDIIVYWYTTGNKLYVSCVVSKVNGYWHNDEAKAHCVIYVSDATSSTGSTYKEVYWYLSRYDNGKVLFNSTVFTINTAPFNIIVQADFSLASEGGPGWCEGQAGNQYTEKYTVTYNANSGSGAPSAQSFYAGVSGKLSSSTPSRTGYTFSKWNTKSDGTGTSYSSGASISLTSSITLYAIWTPITYKVAYNGNGKTSGSMSNSTHTYGTEKALTANAYKRAYKITYNGNSGTSSKSSETISYTFSKWSDNKTTYADKAKVKNLTSTADATVTLYALWDSGTAWLPSATRAGYDFTGWYTSNGTYVGTAGSGYVPTSDITLKASWISEVGAPVFKSFTLSNQTAYSYTINASITCGDSNRSGDCTWYYSENAGSSWTQISSGITKNSTTYSLKYEVTNKSPNTTYNVLLKVIRKSTSTAATSSSKSITTLGYAKITKVTISDNFASVIVNYDAYGSFNYNVKIYYLGNVIYDSGTLSMTAGNNKTFSIGSKAQSSLVSSIYSTARTVTVVLTTIGIGSSSAEQTFTLTDGPIINSSLISLEDIGTYMYPPGETSQTICNIKDLFSNSKYGGKYFLATKSIIKVVIPSNAVSWKYPNANVTIAALYYQESTKSDNFIEAEFYSSEQAYKIPINSGTVFLRIKFKDTRGLYSDVIKLYDDQLTCIEYEEPAVVTQFYRTYNSLGLQVKLSGTFSNWALPDNYVKVTETPPTHLVNSMSFSPKEFTINNKVCSNNISSIKISYSKNGGGTFAPVSALSESTSSEELDVPVVSQLVSSTDSTNSFYLNKTVIDRFISTDYDYVLKVQIADRFSSKTFLYNIPKLVPIFTKTSDDVETSSGVRKNINRYAFNVPATEELNSTFLFKTDQESSKGFVIDDVDYRITNDQLNNLYTILHGEECLVTTANMGGVVPTINETTFMTTLGTSYISNYTYTVNCIGPSDADSAWRLVTAYITFNWTSFASMCSALGLTFSTEPTISTVDPKSQIFITTSGVS